MLVRLADWCYRRRRVVVALWIAALVGSFAPVQRVRWGVPAGLPAARVGVAGGLGDARGALPAAGRRHRPDRAARGRRRRLARRTGPGRDAPRRRRRERPRRGRGQPVHRRRVPARSRRTARRRTPRSRSTRRTTSSPRRRPRRWSSRSWPPATTPCRSRSAAPVAALSQTAPVGSEGIGLVAAAVILLVTFGSAVAMGLPLLTALFGLGIAMALGAVLMRVVDVPEWAPADRRDGRHRRRHRLRAVHRHPVPQQPRRGPGAAARRPDVDRDRRPRRAVRRPHRRRLDARHPADGPAGHDRLRLHGRADTCWSSWSRR